MSSVVSTFNVKIYETLTLFFFFFLSQTVIKQCFYEHYIYGDKIKAEATEAYFVWVFQEYPKISPKHEGFGSKPFN